MIETILFSKSDTLYGFDRAKLVIRQKDGNSRGRADGPSLMVHQAGMNAVASSGNSSRAATGTTENDGGKIF